MAQDATTTVTAYRIVDSYTGEYATAITYKTWRLATMVADRKDAKYGAVRYRVVSVTVTV